MNFNVKYFSSFHFLFFFFGDGLLFNNELEIFNELLLNEIKRKTRAWFQDFQTLFDNAFLYLIHKDK